MIQMIQRLSIIDIFHNDTTEVSFYEVIGGGHDWPGASAIKILMPLSCRGSFFPNILIEMMPWKFFLSSKIRIFTMLSFYFILV